MNRIGKPRLLSTKRARFQHAHAMDHASSPTGGRGPELVSTPVGTGWTSSGPTVVINANSIQVVNGNNNDNAFIAAAVEDNATYEVRYVISALSGGSVRIRVCGATASHNGVTSGKNAGDGPGTYIEQVTTNGAGSNTLRIMLVATGATAGANNFTCTSISVRKVIPG